MPPAQLAFSFGPERAYLNCVVPGGRVSGRNLDRLLAISTAEDVDACDELLDVEERPVAELHLSVTYAQGRSQLRACQGGPQDEIPPASNCRCQVS